MPRYQNKRFLSFTYRGLIVFVLAVALCLGAGTHVGATGGRFAATVDTLLAAVLGTFGWVLASSFCLVAPFVARIVIWLCGTVCSALGFHAYKRWFDTSKLATRVREVRFLSWLKRVAFRASRWAVVLILLLASLVVGAVGGVRQHLQRIEQTKVEAKPVTDGLERHKVEYGKYPKTLVEAGIEVPEPWLDSRFYYRPNMTRSWYRVGFRSDFLEGCEYDSRTGQWTIQSTMLNLLYRD